MNACACVRVCVCVRARAFWAHVREIACAQDNCAYTFACVLANVHTYTYVRMYVYMCMYIMHADIW